MLSMMLSLIPQKTKSFVFVITCLSAHLSGTGAKNMNDDYYAISNSDLYRAEFFGEYFDVYTPPIRTRYSEVYWTPVEPFDIPPVIVERFRNKTMAITGYESDQVRVDDEGNEIPVPITHAYNHHYSASIINSKKGRWSKRMYSKEELANHPQLLGMTHGTGHNYDFVYHNGQEDSTVYTNDENNGAEFAPGTVFSEANGGEYRRTFHGYPKGYAQLVRSPDQFNIFVMQIDTKNRDHGDTPKFYPGPLPRISPVYGDNSVTYSGLVECPCSSRRQKNWTRNYILEDGMNQKCQEDNVQNETECWDAFRFVVPFAPHVEQNTYSGNQTALFGCSLLQRHDGVLQVTWNEPLAEEEEDGVLREDEASFVAFGSNAINATLALHKERATLTLVGPADKWFGIGLGASTMCRLLAADQCVLGGPYAIIVYNDTYLEERVLDFHGKGKVLPATVTIVSNTVKEGNRTVVLTRPLVGSDDRYFSFDSSDPTLNVIMARGCNSTFAQHCGHGSISLQFLPVGKTMRVCRDGISGGFDGEHGTFNKNRCGRFPNSTLLESRNPTCSIETYQGGLACCKHGQSLLDEDQEIPWPDQFLEYRLKFRFYFEEYKPAVETGEKPSHKQLARLYWQTEAFAGEYDVTPCSPGTPRSQCVHVITARWKVRSMFLEGPWGESWGTGPNSSDAEGIELISAMPHCHAPSCLSMELYNADTGDLLCRSEPIVGKSTETVYDELGYLTIPPCLWSDNQEDGLMAPVFLSSDTTLLAIKRNNNTFAHLGEMASWQMRGVIVMNLSKEEELAVSEIEESAPNVEKEKNIR